MLSNRDGLKWTGQIAFPKFNCDLLPLDAKKYSVGHELNPYKDCCDAFSSDNRRRIYSGLQPAIVDAGYRPLRIDNAQFNGNIVDRLMTEIRESRFVVVDLTGHRRGVYFEAGLALAA